MSWKLWKELSTSRGWSGNDCASTNVHGTCVGWSEASEADTVLNWTLEMWPVAWWGGYEGREMGGGAGGLDGARRVNRVRAAPT